MMPALGSASRPVGPAIHASCLCFQTRAELRAKGDGTGSLA
jgi:hypothetical protein